MSQPEANDANAAALLENATALSQTAPVYFDLTQKAEALRKAFQFLKTSCVLIDITAMSNGLIFAALDEARRTCVTARLLYTDAVDYAPTKENWEAVMKQGSGPLAISDIAERQEWISNSNYTVSLVDDHDGYDGAGTSKALVAFLPFKAARLSAIMNNEDYASFYFIAIKPRFLRNLWRLDALKEINRPFLRNHAILDVLAFRYLDTARQLGAILFLEPGLARTHDVHLAILGTKLQTVGAWLVSEHVPAITVVTCTPEKYYPESYSKGIGDSWYLEIPLDRLPV